MKKTLSIATLKSMEKNPELIKLAKLVFEAMAFEQVVRETIEPIQLQVLNEMKLQRAEKWKLLILAHGGTEEKANELLTLSNVYEAEDDAFLVYNAKCESLYPIKPSKEGNCPLLEAESMTRDAKRLFVDATEPYTGLNTDNLLQSANGLENLKEYTELMLKIMSKNIK